jgi:hypothetical protein
MSGIHETRVSAAFQPEVPSDIVVMAQQMAAEMTAHLEKELAYARLKNQVLEARIRQLLINRYGKSSEKLSDLRLNLLESEPAYRTKRSRPRANASRCHPLQRSRTRTAARRLIRSGSVVGARAFLRIWRG